MLKKSITFENFDGETVTETHYFHVSKAELVELEMSQKGGFMGYIERVVEAQDGRVIMEEFKKLILMSYGKKNEDGSRFVKSEELRQDFLSSPAYDAFFMEIVTKPELAAEFVNGIVPQGLKEQMDKLPKPARTVNEAVEAERLRQGGDEPEPVENVFNNDTPIPDAPPASEPLVLSPKEAREMDSLALQQGLVSGALKLGE